MLISAMKPGPMELWPDAAADWMLNLPDWLENIFFKFFKPIENRLKISAYFFKTLSFIAFGYIENKLFRLCRRLLTIYTRHSVFDNGV